MLREIRKKLIIIQNRKPFKDEAIDYIERTEEEDWIAMNLRLEGSSLSGEQISKVMEGECLREISVNDYMQIDHAKSLRRLIYAGALGKERLCKDTLNQMYAIASGNTLAQNPDAVGGLFPGGGGASEVINPYRRTNPVVVQLSYNPPFPQDISGGLDELFKWLYESEDFFAVIDKAAALHNRIMGLYPFEENNEAVARGAMFYYLVQNGLPICNLLMTESDYNLSIVEFLRTGNSDKLAEKLLRGIYNKLDLVLQVTDFRQM